MWVSRNFFQKNVRNFQTMEQVLFYKNHEINQLMLICKMKLISFNIDIIQQLYGKFV